jgi:hypothetical protein
VTRVAERSERITDMFLRLAEDPALLSEFARDPRVALEAAGLTDTQVATVLTGDADTVRTAVADEVARDPVRRQILVAPRMTIYKPEPDSEPEPEPEPDSEPEPEQAPEDRRAVGAASG